MPAPRANRPIADRSSDPLPLFDPGAITADSPDVYGAQPTTNRAATPAAASPATSAAQPAGPITVARLTQEIRTLLQGIYPNLYVEGEVSGCRPAASGHIYFTLKDAEAQIACVMWRTDAARIRQPLRDGAKIEIRGTLDVYPQRGTYQIIVSSVSPAGIGKLYQQFEELKARLKDEGLFEADRKRPLPPFPRLVGIVTSPAGAALRDILKVLDRRAPDVPVLIAPARVQGQGSAEEVALAIRKMNSIPTTAATSAIPRAPRRPDVLIVARGGGSIEDLWAFNEEVVARAIAASEIPIISGVGHETDTTIADFAADRRAPTPSAAAEIAVQDRGELLRHLAASRARLETNMKRHLQPLRNVLHLRARLEQALSPRVRSLRQRIAAFQNSSAVQRPRQRLFELRQRLDEFHGRIERAAGNKTSTMTRQHERLAAQLSALDPKAVLARGYSITLDAQSGMAVRSTAETAARTAGHPLTVVLSDGSFQATTCVAGSGNPTAPTPKKRRASRKKPVSPVAEFFGLDESAASMCDPD